MKMLAIGMSETSVHLVITRAPDLWRRERSKTNEPIRLSAVAVPPEGMSSEQFLFKLISRKNFGAECRIRRSAEGFEIRSGKAHHLAKGLVSRLYFELLIQRVVHGFCTLLRRLLRSLGLPKWTRMVGR